ncbi:phosphotransferase family protein [Salininema proteolyticum]|uniref:Phosphotransferase family protein n=1 Tax=Salininema proteolyticum TaxID=1607685 RepID=A0ABV8U0Y8_9ACTN
MIPDVLAEVCRSADVEVADPVLLHQGENEIWRVNPGTVARMSRHGTMDVRRGEIAAARWFEKLGFPAARLIPGLDQPIRAGDRVVSFWRWIGEHTHGTPESMGTTLRRLHALPQPENLDVIPFSPFIRLRERLEAADVLTERTRVWLLRHYEDLESAWSGLPSGLPDRLIHGDANPANLVVAGGEPVILDFERVCVGPPEWDLSFTAFRHGTFGSLSDAEYETFCEAYGHDVTEWEGYDLMRDLRELRMVGVMSQMAEYRPAMADRARYLAECLQGAHGERPWKRD